jgi:hypothetical protein
MSDKIKLVYNWIGPRGPIWNTELPNILNFANVAPGVKHIDSAKFFGDDLAKFFDAHKHTSEYEIYPSVSIDHNTETRPFIFPFTLTWRIPFSQYFTGRNGILEFSHTPFHIINNVRHNSGYILINHSIEAFMQDDYINSLHSYFSEVHKIPLHKIIYLTGCINAVEIYEQYCTSRGIPNNSHARLSIVTHPVSFTNFIPNTENINDTPPYDILTIPSKLFLMWNRRLRRHRVEMAVNLERHNLVERSLVSFSNEDQDYPGRSIIPNFDKVRLNNSFAINEVCIQQFIDRLPLTLDTETDITAMCQDNDNMTRQFYQQSLISIVTETNFYDNEISLTEKSFKPTKEKHPFIIVGVKGVLKGMHELGFKTFGEFWDESYDDIADHDERMRKLMEITWYISTWTNDQILDFKNKVKPILDHNYEIIRTASTRHAVAKISNIVRNKL